MSDSRISNLSSVFLLIFALATMIPGPVSAQAPNCYGNIGTPAIIHLNGTSLDVKLEVKYGKEQQANFTVSFLNSQTGSNHKDVLYDFTLKDETDKEIFNAAAAANLPTPLHSVSGEVTIPYTITDKGLHTAVVTVYGIHLIPINPQSASFPCVPLPEFPIVIVGTLAAAMSALVIAINRYKKLNGT